MPDGPQPTSERLAAELESKGHAAMAMAARQGYYDEYKTEIPFPLVQLVTDLTQVEEWGLIERVKAGDFDATREEAAAWAASPEGLESFGRLLSGE